MIERKWKRFRYRYGIHGCPHLSLLNLLASITPVIFALGDRLYQRCRSQESRRELWNALRTLVNTLLGVSWTHLLELYLEDADTSP